MAETRPVPDRQHAAGMLEGILSQRRLEGLADPGPYASLDLDDPTDRRIIGSVYALMARAALDQMTGAPA